MKWLANNSVLGAATTLRLSIFLLTLTVFSGFPIFLRKKLAIGFVKVSFFLAWLTVIGEYFVSIYVQEKVLPYPGDRVPDYLLHFIGLASLIGLLSILPGLLYFQFSKRVRETFTQ